ncbi:hypothetical protein [Pseudomonas sp. D(2018)]|uniref:hypothetical protein n=1 Tax=Pseudomonas sp. D(2018) TaxID=2502238 RepID=UPI0010F6874E|nr:hypothetical protein [Pseudomonas sp. D(2018)]
MDYVNLALAAAALFVAYCGLSDDGRTRFNSALNNGFGIAKKAFGLFVRITITVLPLSVVLISAWNVWRFYTSSEPITRHEVVVLVACSFNFFFYLSLLGAVLKLWYMRITNSWKDEESIEPNT